MAKGGKSLKIVAVGCTETVVPVLSDYTESHPTTLKPQKYVRFEVLTER
jgi:hypothetical protein